MSYNVANQLVQSVTGGETTKYSYDANGSLVKSENAGGARSYTYNALGLLAKFTREDGYTETYTYNVNRLLSGVATSDGLTSSLTWDILYGDGVVISESKNGEATSYTYGLERISALTGRTRTEYVHDGRGSVAAEVSYNDSWYTFGGNIGADYNGRQMAPGVRLRASQDMSGSRPCQGSTTQVYYRKEAIPCPGQGPRNIVQNVGTLHSNSVKKRALRAGSDLSAVTRRGRLRAGARSVTSSRDALIRRSRPAKTRATCPTSQLCCVSGSFHGFAAAGRTR